jgi:hypothetical protein
MVANIGSMTFQVILDINVVVFQLTQKREDDKVIITSTGCARAYRNQK